MYEPANMLNNRGFYSVITWQMNVHKFYSITHETFELMTMLMQCKIIF